MLTPRRTVRLSITITTLSILLFSCVFANIATQNSISKERNGRLLVAWSCGWPLIYRSDFGSDEEFTTTWNGNFEFVGIWYPVYFVIDLTVFAYVLVGATYALQRCIDIIACARVRVSDVLVSVTAISVVLSVLKYDCSPEVASAQFTYETLYAPLEQFPFFVQFSLLVGLWCAVFATGQAVCCTLRRHNEGDPQYKPHQENQTPL
jgi:hypothetical protein